MPYQFQAGKMYRMPTHFGPRTGPRQGPDGQRFENKDTPKTTTVTVTFLTNRQQLEALLPERFTVAALEIKEYRGASITKTCGAKDLSDQRILV